MKEAARRLLERHRAADALAAAHVASGLFPADADARAVLAMALVRTAQYQDGLQVAEALPAEIRARDDLAFVLRAAERALEGDRHITRGIASDGLNVSAFETGASLMEEAVAIDPANLSTREALAWVYLDKLGDPDRAVPHLSTILRLVPEAPQSRRLLGLAYSQTGRLSPAVRIFRILLTEDPADRYLQFSLARTLSWAGALSEAESIYRSLLLADPEDLQVHVGLIELQAWRGDTRQAIDAAEQLVSNHPKAPAARTLLGDVYRSNWQVRDASREYETALDLEPDYAPADSGLRTIRQMRAVRLEPRAFHFTDSRDFAQTMAGFSGAVPIAERAFLGLAFEEWRFRAGESLSSSRSDIGAEFAYHWNASVETRGGVWVVQASDSDAAVSPRMSAKWSPSGRADIYLSGAFRVPVTDSILTVRNSLSSDTVGFGVDASFGSGVSLQASGSLSAYSDDNRRRAFMSQVSYELPQMASTIVRLQYDLHTFSDNRPDYFTPSRFHLVRPTVEARPRLSRQVGLIVKGELPFVLTERKIGSGVTAGLELGTPEGTRGEVVFFRHRVPGGAEVWSGNGLRASFSIGVGR